MFKALSTTQTGDWFRKQPVDINHTKQKILRKTSKLLTPKTLHSVAPLLSNNTYISDAKGKASVLKETFFSGRHRDGLETGQMHEIVV